MFFKNILVILRNICYNIKSVKTTDFMIATWSRIPYEVLEKASSKIVNEVNHTNRLVASKLLETIKWE